MPVVHPHRPRHARGPARRARADATTTASSLNLVHRDVSPQNILVGINGTARITDFGVARAATRLSSTRSGQLKGKLAYMAPEQARGGDIDRRADVFAVGTVLWEVLADKRLFKGEGEADTLNRVLFEPIPACATLRRRAPGARSGHHEGARARSRASARVAAQAFADELERAARSLARHRHRARGRRVRAQGSRPRHRAAARSGSRVARAERTEPNRSRRSRYRLSGGPLWDKL